MENSNLFDVLNFDTVSLSLNTDVNKYSLHDNPHVFHQTPLLTIGAQRGNEIILTYFKAT